MGSIGVAAAFAKLAFVGLVVAAVVRQEMGPIGVVAFATIGMGLWFGLPIVAGDDRFVTSTLAIVDVALVFAVFKGDVRIT